MLQGLKTTCVIKRASRLFSTFGQSSTRNQWQSRNLTSKHLSSTLIPWQPPLAAWWNQGKVQKIHEGMVLPRLAQTCHQALLTGGPWWREGEQCAHTWSPSQQAGTVSKAPAESTRYPTRPSPRQSKEIKNSILRWKIIICPGTGVSWWRSLSLLTMAAWWKEIECLRKRATRSEKALCYIYFGQGQWRRNQEHLRL